MNLCKPKYIVQRDDYNCGTVSLINLEQWLGTRDLGLKDIPSVREELYPTETLEKELRKMEAGVDPLYFDLYMLFNKHIKDKLVLQKNQPTISDLKQEFKLGRALILSFWWPDKEWGHYTFVSEFSNRKFTCVNYVGRKVFCKISEKEMKKNLEGTRVMPGSIKVSCIWSFQK